MLCRYSSCFLLTFIVLLPLLESFGCSSSRLLTGVHRTPASTGWRISLMSGPTWCLHHHDCLCYHCGRGGEGWSRQHSISSRPAPVRAAPACTHLGYGVKNQPSGKWWQGLLNLSSPHRAALELLAGALWVVIFISYLDIKLFLHRALLWS